MRSISVTLAVAALTALLLPSGAMAQEPDGPLPPPVCQPDCWWPVDTLARLDSLRATVEVTEGVMVARYRFDLSDPTSPEIDAPVAEGRVVFPVPTGSSVSDLTLSGGPQTLEGSLLGADDAARIYEDIVRRMVDPALLRSVGTDLYEVRAFPVPAGETRQISFTVTTPLLAQGDAALVDVPWSRMSPRPAAASISVDVEVPWDVRTAIAPGFDLETQRTGPGEVDVAWESADGWSADTDFRLHLGGGTGLVDARLLAHRTGDEDGHFGLLFAPVVSVDTVVARDVVLVLDVSGSMEGHKMEQAKTAAEYVLAHLADQDRFSVVSFSGFVSAFSDDLRPASETSAGIAYVRDLSAGGETNISGALERGLGLLSGERPGTVIFLTDGLPTAGIEDPRGILDVAERSAPDRTQLFAFGVGSDVDTVLLDALSGRFVGTSHYVSPDERIDTEVQRLFERITTPVLTDIQVTVEGVETSELAPAGITGLFAGHQALLTGRYQAGGHATVIVIGNSAQGPERFEYPVEFPERDETDPTIAQLWAQRRVADLLTEVRVEGPRDSLIERIVDIATRFGIVTPYTSYLAQEPDLAFQPEEARRAVNDAVAAAPASGEDAVQGASDLEALRAGRFELGGRTARVVGDHTYYDVDDAWVRDGYAPGTVAPVVVVGSDAFLALLGSDPSIAAAAALGERVVVEGPDGWVTLVWPDPVAAGTLAM